MEAESSKTSELKVPYGTPLTDYAPPSTLQIAIAHKRLAGYACRPQITVRNADCYESPCPKGCPAFLH